MAKRRKQDKDGVFQRPDSPFWWMSLPDGRGGTARRSTRVPIAEDPDGLKAKVIRAQALADGSHTHAPHPGDQWTLDDLVLAYLREVTPTKKAPERDRYSAKHLYRHFTGRPLAQIGAEAVREYIASRKRNGASPGTLNKEIGFASSCWTWGLRELELPIENPWRSRRQKEPSGRDRWLTPDELDSLLHAARSAPGHADAYLPEFISLCVNAGLRPGEALGLEWERVNLGRGFIQFDAGETKGGKAALVPINAGAREALLSRARFRSEWCPGSPWVFCRRDGSQIASIKKSFASCVKRAGLHDVHPHDCRRTCGSLLIQAGEDIARVSAILRHSSVDVTARVYAHLRPSDLAASASALDRLLVGTSR